MGENNPFRIGEHVRGAFFTDRVDEVRVLVRAMRDGGRLLVWGPRRMGKSTAIGVAAERIRRAGGVVLSVDLATVTSLTEAAERLLAAVSREERWHDRLASWVKSLAPVVTLGSDAAGQPRLGISLEARPVRAEYERALLERVLDRIHAMQGEQNESVVVVLDEVQQLAQIGGEAAEWLLRNRMQEHRGMGYICAGSKETLVREMLQPKRAFYNFFELLHVGPIDSGHLGQWIDERLGGAGVNARGIGSVIIDAVGPRTQDILLTARTLWFRLRASGRARAADVAATIEEIVTSEDAALRKTWEDLSLIQQRVLKAIAAGAEQLHSEETRRQFTLGASSSVGTALNALMNRAILGRRNGTVSFDSPFFRAWVVREVLTKS